MESSLKDLSFESCLEILAQIVQEPQWFEQDYSFSGLPVSQWNGIENISSHKNDGRFSPIATKF